MALRNTSRKEDLLEAQRKLIPEHLVGRFDRGVELLRRLGVSKERMASLHETTICSLGLQHVSTFAVIRLFLENIHDGIKTDFTIEDLLKILREDLEKWSRQTAVVHDLDVAECARREALEKWSAEAAM